MSRLIWAQPMWFVEFIALTEEKPRPMSDLPEKTPKSPKNRGLALAIPPISDYLNRGFTLLPQPVYSTVTDLARFLGWSTSFPR